jgi:hypothetical protein
MMGHRNDEINAADGIDRGEGVDHEDNEIDAEVGGDCGESARNSRKAVVFNSTSFFH